MPLSQGRQYGASVLLVMLVALTCYAASPFLEYRVVALILLVTVSLIAISFDILPVLLAAVLSAFIWDFFFIPPRFNLHVNTTDDAILLLMYFIIVMINGVLTYKIRKAEKISRLKEERANSVSLYNTVLDSLSHELRTPIATIIGATDNLQMNDQLPQGHRDQLLSEISHAALRLNQQVENLLNLSRLESGHIQPRPDWCDITELVHATVRKVEENGTDQKISISVPTDMPLCLTDRGMLEQVLYNLVNNAAVHTPPGSRIEISAYFHTDLLQFIVEDGGSGFPKHDWKDVFNKLSRERRSKSGGSGLGLSIVKGFTDALNGTVELDKSHLGGARFTLVFPVRSTTLNS